MADSKKIGEDQGLTTVNTGPGVGGENPEDIIAAAKVEAQKIIDGAKAEAQAIAGAAPKVEYQGIPTTTDELEKLVSIKLFKDNGRYKDDVFVGLNGQTWQIKRGVEVSVPKKVALVIEESLTQDEYTATVIQGYADEFETNKNMLV